MSVGVMSALPSSFSLQTEPDWGARRIVTLSLSAKRSFGWWSRGRKAGDCRSARAAFARKKRQQTNKTIGTAVEMASFFAFFFRAKESEKGTNQAGGKPGTLQPSRGQGIWSSRVESSPSWAAAENEDGGGTRGSDRAPH